MYSRKPKSCGLDEHECRRVDKEEFLKDRIKVVKLANLSLKLGLAPFQ